jgi:hypothetical protein
VGRTSSAETVKQADRAAKDQDHDDFASLAIATRRPDKPMQNGRPEFRALRLTSLARAMQLHLDDSAQRLSW